MADAIRTVYGIEVQGADKVLSVLKNQLHNQEQLAKVVDKASKQYKNFSRHVDQLTKTYERLRREQEAAIANAKKLANLSLSAGTPGRARGGRGQVPSATGVPPSPPRDSFIFGGTQPAKALETTRKSADRAARSYIGYSSAANKAATATKRNTNAIKQANSATKDYIRSLGFMGRLVIASLVSRGIGAAIRAFTEGIASAVEFQIRISEIRTIAQDNQQAFETWTDSVRQLSDAFGAPILDVAEANYQTLSNQIAKGAEVTRFMAEAQRFALIGVSSTTDAVSLLTGTLNAYNLSSSDAREVSNSFFKTIEQGRLRASDIANTMGNVTIVGKQLGASFDEVNAALATLTIQGVGPSVAMTGLRNVFLKLIRPTDKMKEIFAEWGVESGAAAVAAFGLEGVLQKLAKRAAESTDPMNEIGEAFGRIRAIMGATGLARAFDKYSLNLEEIRNGAEEADKALKLIQESAGYKMRVELNKLKNFFIVDLGTSLLESVNKFNNAIGGFTNALQTVAGNIDLISAAIAGLLAWKFVSRIYKWVTALTAAATAQISLSATTSALTLRVKVLIAHLLSLRALYVGVAAVGVYAIFQISKEWKKATAAFGELSAEQLRRHRETEAKKLEATLSTAKEQFKIWRELLQAETQTFRKEAANARAELYKLIALKEDQESAEDRLNDSIITRLKGLEKANFLVKIYEKLLVRYNNALKEGDEKAIRGITARLKAYESQLEALHNTVTRARNLAQPGILTKRGAGPLTGRGIQPTRGIVTIGQGGEFSQLKTLHSVVQLQKIRENLERKHLKNLLEEGDFRNISTKNEERLNEALGKKLKLMDDVDASLNKAERDFKTYATAQADAITKIGSAIIDPATKFPGIWRQAFRATEEDAKESFAVIKEIFFGRDIDRSFLLYTEINKADQALQDIKESATQLELALSRVKENQPISGEQLALIIAAKNEYVRLLDIINKVYPIGSINQVKDDLRTAVTALRETQKEFRKVNSAVNQLKRLTDEARRLRDVIDTLDYTTEDFEEQLKFINLRGAQLLSVWLQLNYTMAESPEVMNKNKAALSAMALEVEHLRFEMELLNRTIPSKPEGFQIDPRTQGSEGNFLPKYTGDYMKRFAGGGSVGSDSISAKLSPGEFVMSAAQSRKYLPHLMAMNSRAARFENGGVVNNNNSVGDITVNVAGTSSDARTIAAEIRREMRRGTSRLN